nr:immunoglobulin light chain junction region [Macaca mulatta]MOW28949.1 immunoglobulin light chain junction region [Macaca mulatta]MOW28963.1 immunoglobulin light chain junction region [Macaca mulatta]MOW29142.1 immunoglobulin light chain junction region [Macaca mulatta]MOW29228.1 immunoglobulin light chain junction region [Macaca mulatta]
DYYCNSYAGANTFVLF